MSASELLAELALPACFPHAPDHVQIVQTHLSVVCLAGELVYKLKKAITLPFVDFATLPARRATCRDEVRLNRRLCPDTYLGTAALRRRNGVLRFAATGDDEGSDDLDVAVVMRRLPAEAMLDELVRQGRATQTGIERLARHMARFHARADRGPEVREAGDPQQLAAFAAANFTELQAMPGHGLPEHLLTQLASASAADFAHLLPALRLRAAVGKVVDGHGDLHARNICMTEPPTVYDCIEFKDAFRCGDVATENAFLAMDLRHRGAPELATAYVRAYAAASGDDEMAALLPVLCCYRAMVRAKVAALAAADAELPAGDRDGARHSAHQHLLLAAAFAIEARGPCWLLVCGPPASGKSRLCETIATDTHWRQIRTDLVRKQLAGFAPTEHANAEHYTAEFSQRTYAEVLARAADATRQGDTVVMLDGNFPTPEHRASASTAASAAGARLVVAFVDIDAATAAERAARRQHEPGNVSDAGPEQLPALRARFVPPTAAECARLHRLDGAAAPADLASELLGYMLEGPDLRPTQGQPSVTRCGGMALRLTVTLVVVSVIAAAVGLALWYGLMVWALSPTEHGTPLSVEHARRVVAEQEQILAGALALSHRSPLPKSDDAKCRSLAAELGALDIRFEDRLGGPWVIIAYSRGGIAETYETQLTWVPAATAERVRAGGYRLGEAFEYIDGGWWWVFW